MLDYFGWLLDISEKSDLREQVEQLRRARDANLRQIPLERRLEVLERENEDLKLRLGLVIRMLAKRGTIDVQELVSSFKEMHEQRSDGNRNG
jgi:hypothetical protein